MRELNIIKESIAKLRGNERESKELIAVLAIECVQRLHQHNDTDTLNQFVLACSPANQKMVLKFAKEFTGHKIGEGTIGKRTKPFTKDNVVHDAYQKAKDAFDNFVLSGMNIWQWAFQEREHEEKPVDIKKLGEQFQKKAQKAIDSGVSKLAVFEAATGGLFTADDMFMMLQAMMDAEAAATAAMKKAAAPKAEEPKVDPIKQALAEQKG